MYRVSFLPAVALLLFVSLCPTGCTGAEGTTEKRTPDVVYVGYTPGYTGSYVSHGCVVYGTGWWYRPWWGHYYYPRPSTWGFHVRWNPWWGWSFGLSYTSGPFRFSIGWGGYGGYPRYGGWWGSNSF